MAAAAAAEAAEDEEQQLDFGLAAEVRAVLPSDPFEQLDVARKITSIALATRVSKLETEAARLRQRVAERDAVVAELRAEVEALDAALADLSHRLELADQEKVKLLHENASLSNTVRRLTRDVSKLETFRKTLMKSFQEEEEGSQGGAPKVIQRQIIETSSFSTGSLIGEEDAAVLPSKLSSTKIQISDSESSVSENAAVKDSTAYGSLSASYSSTPNLSPRRSPPRLPTTRSPTRSPTRQSNPVSPRRHSVALSTAKSMLDDRSSLYSSMPSSLHGSMNSPFDAEPQTAGRTRIDGKEFFRQVRSRLSYEQFSAFLANVKELNAHKQTREETLRKADEIFGPGNKDLYAIFEGLINRNLH